MTLPPSLADDIAALRSYAITGEDVHVTASGDSLCPESAARLVHELTVRTAGLDHLQRLFRLAVRVTQIVGDDVECSCTWSTARPGVRTNRPTDCPIHGAMDGGLPRTWGEIEPCLVCPACLNGVRSQCERIPPGLRP